MSATLKLREEQLWAKKMECEVLRRELVKEKELREEEELRTGGLRRQIATMKTVTMDLQRRIEACWKAHIVELRRLNELMASLAVQTRKHEAKLTSWMQELTKCEAAKSLKIKCRVKLNIDCDQL